MRKTFTKSSPAVMASAEMARKLSAGTLATATSILSDFRPAFHFACSNRPWPEQLGEKPAAYQFRSQVRAFQFQLPHNRRLFQNHRAAVGRQNDQSVKYERPDLPQVWNQRIFSVVAVSLVPGLDHFLKKPGFPLDAD